MIGNKTLSIQDPIVRRLGRKETAKKQYFLKLKDVSDRLTESEKWDVLGWHGWKPEEKVNIAMDMADACVCICAEGIRARCPGITEEELLAKVRGRLDYTRQRRNYRSGSK